MNQEINSVLPESFDGVFRFTNFTDEDFTTLWNSVEYTFPAMSTVPLVISGESPENTQTIRKIFAKRLAQREFFKSSRYAELNGLTAKSGVPPLVNEDVEYAQFIQKCLEPLAPATVKAKKLPKIEASVSEHTKVVGEKDSLKAGSTDESFSTLASE